MQDQGSEGAQPSSRQQDTFARNIAGAARNVYDKATELGSEAADRGRAAAADGARAAKSEVKGLLDRQMGAAASVVGDVARSFHVAADDLGQSTPFAGDLLHGVADRMAGYAEDLEGQKIDDVLRAATDFTRRQPAVVFGLAALAGMLLFRTVKHTPGPAVRAPSIQPSQHDFDDDGDEELGTGTQPRRRRRKRIDDL